MRPEQIWVADIVGAKALLAHHFPNCGPLDEVDRLSAPTPRLLQRVPAPGAVISIRYPRYSKSYAWADAHPRCTVGRWYEDAAEEGDVRAIWDALDDATTEPVLIHCLGGQTRSTGIAASLLARAGRSPTEVARDLLSIVQESERAGLRTGPCVPDRAVIRIADEFLALGGRLEAAIAAAFYKNFR